MVVREQHQAVVRDHIGLIGMARKNHLPADRLLSCRDLLATLAHHQFARLTLHGAIGPEDQRDRLAL